MEKLRNIINSLSQVQGLSNPRLLSKDDKAKILGLEEERNRGVLEAIKRPYTIVLTHDSSFREPAGQIVVNNAFPPVPFPEVKAKSVVSSSPSAKVHNHLVSRFKLDVSDEDATLLIGFEL